MLADDEIGLSVFTFDADWQSARDAFLRAIRVFFAGRAVIDVAGHVQHFAFNGDFPGVFGRIGIPRLMLVAFVAENWDYGNRQRSGQRHQCSWFLHCFVLSVSWFLFLQLLISPQVSISFPPYGLETSFEVCTQSFFTIGQCRMW